MPVNNEEGYSTITGLIYIFNLIVGTGALALPGAIGKAGWFLGFIMVCLLGLVSFITVTFILEALSIVNALARKNASLNTCQEELEDEAEDTPLVCSATEIEGPENPYEIKQKYEIGEMATLLLSKPARLSVFLCLIVYLLGDLSIYCAVVAKTLAHVLCTYRSDTSNTTHFTDDMQCWSGYKLSRLEVYRILVCFFTICVGPFTFFNLQKTKFLQILTACMRWIAFLVMISWSIQKICDEGRQGDPPLANFFALPTLFGACVYSFMCQHSIPGLIEPIRKKYQVKKMVTFAFALITTFYLLLAITAIYAFQNVQSLYTLNFWYEVYKTNPSICLVFLDYYLALFPVFTLSTSFPIVGITLRNNVKNFFFPMNDANVQITSILSFVVIVIPVTLALVVHDLQVLVGVVGSYAGAGVQYLIPCLLVEAARRQAKSLSLSVENPYISPFGRNIWVYGVYVWMLLSLTLITINYICDFQL